MASTSYTPNLGLCAWDGADRPKRTDFVNDNAVIDQVLGEHINNVGMHVTSEEKKLYANPYSVLSYVGDGAATKSFPLTEVYSFAIVFQKYYPSVTFDSNQNAVSRFAIVGRLFGSSSTMSMNSTSITIKQDAAATNGVINNFNQNGGQYVMLLFK